MDGRHLPYGRHRTRRTGRLVRHVPGDGVGYRVELLGIGVRRLPLAVGGRYWSSLYALTPWRRPDLGQAACCGWHSIVRMNRDPLDPQQRQETWRTSSIAYLRWLCGWWLSVCNGRVRCRAARSSPRFLPALGYRLVGSLWVLRPTGMQGRHVHVPSPLSRLASCRAAARISSASRLAAATISWASLRASARWSSACCSARRKISPARRPRPRSGRTSARIGRSSARIGRASGSVLGFTHHRMVGTLPLQ
jgi:hypothetical protein